MPKLSNFTGSPWHIDKFKRAEGDGEDTVVDVFTTKKKIPTAVKELNIA